MAAAHYPSILTQCLRASVVNLRGRGDRVGLALDRLEQDACGPVRGSAMLFPILHRIDSESEGSEHVTLKLRPLSASSARFGTPSIEIRGWGIDQRHIPPLRFS